MEKITLEFNDREERNILEDMNKKNTEKITVTLSKKEWHEILMGLLVAALYPINDDDPKSIFVDPLTDEFYTDEEMLEKLKRFGELHEKLTELVFDEEYFENQFAEEYFENQREHAKRHVEHDKTGGGR